MTAGGGAEEEDSSSLTNLENNVPTTSTLLQYDRDENKVKVTCCPSTTSKSTSPQRQFLLNVLPTIVLIAIICAISIVQHLRINHLENRISRLERVQAGFQVCSLYNILLIYS